MTCVQGLAVSTFQVVLVPTLVGVIANEFFHEAVKRFTAWLPLVGVAITTLLCASPCAQVATVLRYLQLFCWLYAPTWLWTAET